MDRKAYDNWLKYPQFFRIALIDGRFAGYVAAFPGDEDKMILRLAMPREDIRKLARERPKIFYNNAIVLPEYRRRGLTSMILDDIRETAKKEGDHDAFCSAWMHDGKVTASGTVKRICMRPVLKEEIVVSS